MKRSVPLFAAAVTIGVAAALSDVAVATEWECGERSNLPMAGKNYCAAGDFRQSAINLSAVLNDLLDRHQQKYGDTSELNASQIAFESYRDNQCIAENRRIENKPFHPMIVAQCKTRLSNLRIDELRRMLQRDQ